MGKCNVPFESIQKLFLCLIIHDVFVCEGLALKGDSFELLLGIGTNRNKKIFNYIYLRFKTLILQKIRYPSGKNHHIAKSLNNPNEWYTPHCSYSDISVDALSRIYWANWIVIGRFYPVQFPIPAYTREDSTNMKTCLLLFEVTHILKVAVSFDIEWAEIPNTSSIDVWTETCALLVFPYITMNHI